MVQAVNPDDTYDNTAWATVSSGLFQLQQINHVSDCLTKMEIELLFFLNFELYIRVADYNEFCLSLDNRLSAANRTIGAK
jgi:hypothetical protein